jgi:peptidyl-prolyl cis-trans isomerase SurA
MKNTIFALLLISFSSSFAQISSDNRSLFTVAGEKVSVSDFEYVYNKNNVNNQADYSEKSLRDYLNLYQNFRLKVKEAEGMKLDTISSLKSELEGYRKQLAKSYLTDREISDKLITEAYERSKTDINASHILVRLDENANPADTFAAFKKIMNLRKRIEKGETFEKVARENSEDPSAKTNEGNIGWFTVFGTIYPFENAAYSAKPNELSMPVRTEFGYHLVKVNKTRAARGQVRVAHLLVRFSDNATATQKDSVKRKIESILKEVQTGVSTFEDAVKAHSDDKASRVKNGELQWFGSGATVRMVPEFEEAAFALEKDGQISQPVQTQYGWHIIKRLEKRDIQPFNEVKADVKKKVERDTRSQVAKSVLINRIKSENGFAQFPDSRKSFLAAVDSNLTKGVWKADSSIRTNKALFVLAGKNYTQNDFSEYIEKIAKKRTDKGKEALINEYYEGFVNAKCLEYEESMLETKKPEFRNLMKEYRDGILLFELMDRQVWTKAVKDTIGLEEYRQKNANKYMWGNRADVVIFNASDEKTAKAAYKLATKGKSLEAIKAKVNKEGSASKVSTIEGKYEKGQYDVVDKLDWKVGFTPVQKLGENSYQFTQTKAIVNPEPKNLKEAKGYIVSDYQEYLEKTWLAQLKAKYPILTDETVLKSLIKK